MTVSLAHSFGPYAIVGWHGAIADIPSGFALCDGNNGAPDLRDEFIIAAGDTYAPDDSGGAAAHDHNFTSNIHVHKFEAGPSQLDGLNYNRTVGSEVATGTTDAQVTAGPFNSFYWIMELP